MIIEPKYNLKQIVYLKTDAEQKERLVTCFVVRENDILYELACGESCSAHFDFEIAIEKNVLITSTN